MRAWIGNVEVPVAIGPDGRVRLLATGRLSAPVRVEVTRTTAQAFTVGAGGTILFPGALDAGRGHGHARSRSTASRSRSRAAPATRWCCRARPRAALAIVTVVRTETQLFQLPLAPASDNDTVHAETSTLPLIIFGGVGNDVIHGGQGADVIFGDRGRVLYFDPSKPMPAIGPVLDDIALAALEAAASSVFGHAGAGDRTDGVARALALAISADHSLGGNDTITSGGGDDIVIGGVGADVIDAGEGSNVVFGDNGQLTVRRARPDARAATSAATTASRPARARDLVFGGAGDDTLVLGGGDDIALGDHGALVLSGAVPACRCARATTTTAPATGSRAGSATTC